ncbi:hypothetical protein HGP05_11070 [Streptococcus sanguinis]|uniref:Uncharacterized protein n=1 Tax=Streptococcus sanguinis TaxID=1305 RepID=A0A7Y0YRQ2_STRSA|nr:hypothetical protein [Streptococcus sanguinis]
MLQRLLSQLDQPELLYSDYLLLAFLLLKPLEQLHFDYLMLVFLLLKLLESWLRFRSCLSSWLIGQLSRCRLWTSLCLSAET